LFVAKLTFPTTLVKGEVGLLKREVTINAKWLLAVVGED